MRRPLQLVLVIGLLAILAYGLRGQSYQAAEHLDTLRLWALNVGQGDAVLLDTPDHKQILVDGGPNSSILTELGRVLPVGDKEIDLVILTHVHADHMNGLLDVLRHYKVGKVWTSGATNTTVGYKTFAELLEDKKIPTEIVQTGTRVEFGDLRGIVLAPSDNWRGQLPKNQHDANVITFWEYGQQTILETGDGETEQEEALANRGLLRPVTILKVGHHGSVTSTGETLLTAIRPKIALISVGPHNKYGHPHQATLDRLARFNIPVLRTDQEGAIRCDITLVNFTCSGIK